MTINNSNTMNSEIKKLCKAGGISSIIFILYSLVTMVILMVLGGPPNNAIDSFVMFQDNRVIGLLRMDILTVIFILLYFPIFLGIFLAFHGKRNAWLIIALLSVFVGVTLLLATPSVFSMMNLSDKYALTENETQRNQLLAAGEAILASDMWHGTGAIIGSFLIQIGALIFSIMMLPGKIFSKFTAYVGIITHGLDLAHLLFLLLVPTIGVAIMAIAGTLYLLWLPLIGVRLNKIGNEK
jgi:hypothetical protein